MLRVVPTPSEPDLTPIHPFPGRGGSSRVRRVRIGRRTGRRGPRTTRSCSSSCTAHPRDDVALVAVRVAPPPSPGS